MNIDKVKDELKDRISVLKCCLGNDGPIDRLDYHFLNEIEFLESLLKIVEPVQAK